MRELKFRAWCIPKNNMQKVQAVYTDGKAIALEDLQTYTSNDFKLMQYTGLKDKNGVEIYEGDIIEYGKTNRVPFYAVCIFENAKFQWKVYDTHDTYLDYDLLSDYEDNWVEVIGNIYENSNLLE